jgi:rubredoxin-NAD+ reductase
MSFRKFSCQICDHIYDEEKGTRWEDIPADWACPECGATKADFQVMACELS